MRQSEKVSADAQGVSIATGDVRNNVNSILYLTDKEIIQLFQSFSPDELEKLAPLLRVLFYLISTLKDHSHESCSCRHR